MTALNAVELLETLLRQYSPTLQEQGAVETLAAEMQALGFNVNIDPTGNVHGSLGEGPAEIVLLGHIDTVPGEIAVRKEGDLLYGRGAVDAKGPLACFTAAAVSASTLPGWKITVIGAVGEEGDSRGAKAISEQYLLSRLPDYCVIGEPSGWDHLTLGYKGSAWIEYQVQCSLAHSAAQVESACDAALHFWYRVQEAKTAFNENKARAFDQLSASLRKMQSGDDGFYETAQLIFNFRLPPDLSPQGALQQMSRIAGDGQLSLLDGVQCYRAEKNTALVRAFLSAVRSEGGKPGFLLKTGTSDMNIVGPAWGCPILAYGPGDSNLDHTPNEHIPISEYLAGVRVLSQALRNIQVSSA